MPKIILIIVEDDGDVQVHHFNDDTPTPQKPSASMVAFEKYLKKCKEIDKNITTVKK